MRCEPGSIHRRTLASICALAGALLVAGASQAERPRIYAIPDVRIVTAPGQVIERGTLVLRDGFIDAAGPGVAVPADAQLIPTEDGWTVYAAFVDAASIVGLEPEPEAAPRAPGGNKPERVGVRHELKSVRAERAIADRLDASHPSIERHRSLGFAVAHVLPQNGVFRGESAAILLRSGPATELILTARLGQVVALETSSFIARQYPSSKIGAVAAVRQVLLDATRQQLWNERYAANPASMQHPEYRASDAALIAVLRQEQPVVFVSLAGLDPGRFKDIAGTFELRGMTVAQGLGDRREDLAAAGMPILLPLEMPEQLDLDDPDVIVATGLRGMQAAVRAPGLPAALDNVGVEFAFVTAGMKSVRKFSENLAAVVEAGLPPEVALAALTTTPARLLGLDRTLGTIEAGKQANILVVDGELFAAKPALRHLFVNGYHEEIEVEEVIGDPNAVVDPRGTWEVVSAVMGRTAESTWTVTGAEGNYRGFSESSRAGKSQFSSVDLKGNALTVVSKSSRGELEITVVISGDKLSGSTDMESARGSAKMEIEGRRIAGPEGDLQ
ncbi:MAG: amidohydrolase family protein [Gammaproteobacteria bacterium]|nr:amidohydrolase family protein [Gammaproteobacteria bacterium]